jgi:hypothetical protein
VGENRESGVDNGGLLIGRDRMRGKLQTLPLAASQPAVRLGPACRRLASKRK